MSVKDFFGYFTVASCPANLTSMTMSRYYVIAIENWECFDSGEIHNVRFALNVLVDGNPLKFTTGFDLLIEQERLIHFLMEMC